MGTETVSKSSKKEQKSRTLITHRRHRSAMMTHDTRTTALMMCTTAAHLKQPHYKDQPMVEHSGGDSNLEPSMGLPTNDENMEFVDLPRLPASVMLHVGAFVRRTTWNRLAQMNKEVYQMSQSVPCPWPRIRFRVGSRAWSVAFAPDSMWLACGTDNGTIQIWNCRDGQSKTLAGHHGRVNAVCYCKDHRLASGGDDRTVRLWDGKSGDCLAVFRGHTSTVCSVAMKANTIASGSLDQTVRVYDMENTSFGTILEAHRGAILSIAISPDGQTLASGGADEKLLLWNLATLTSEILCQDSRGDIRSIAYSPNSEFLAFCCGSTIRIYNFTLKSWSVLRGNASNIRSISIASDGLTLASGCSGGMIRLWSVSDTVCLKKWKGHNDFLVCSLEFAPNGRTLLSAGSDGTIALWNI
jgi:WD40 repeat protein